jgi:hypothetical protein
MNTDQFIHSFLRTYVVPTFRQIIREELHNQVSKFSDTPESEFLTAQEAANFIGDALQTFYGRTSRGEINTYGSGKRIFCKKSELIAWKKKHRTKSKETYKQEVRTRAKNKRAK